MNAMLTNAEFHEAWKNLSFHHAPEGYWDRENEQRRKHRFVGRKIRDRGQVLECVRATDTQAIFKLDSGGELIINGDDLENLNWIKE